MGARPHWRLGPTAGSRCWQPRDRGADGPASAGAASIWPGGQFADLAVESIIDLTLDEATAVVRHQLTLPRSSVPRQLELRRAGQVPGAPYLPEGGRISRHDGRWLLELSASPMKEQSVILSYVTPLVPRESTAGRRVGLGLLWPEGATRCRRACGSGAVRPQLASGLAWPKGRGRRCRTKPWPTIPACPRWCCAEAALICRWNSR